jgi:hypothetical protein
MIKDALQQIAITANEIGIPKVEASDTTLQQIVGGVFLAIGSIAVFFLLVAAARYVTANGEQGKISQAKNSILYSLVGIVISVLGFTIVQFVIGKVNGNI